MKRHIIEYLMSWKNNDLRKSLLVRGARQVGKTYSVRSLGKSFKHFLEVNFEEEPDVSGFFKGSLNPAGICEKLSAYYNIPVIPGETLVFFDEIQACPDALRALRFFNEKMPSLHVAAAGSLLEFTLSEIPSFGVGRITSLFMYPLTFAEFVTAAGNSALLDVLDKAGTRQPLDDVLHGKLLEEYRRYQVLGGMPAVVEAYRAGSDIRECQVLLDQLVTSLKDDFAKYKKRAPVNRLEDVFNSVVVQTGGKFTYSKVSSTGSSHASKDALDLLVKAGLAYKVFHTAARGLPLGGQVNPRKFKVLLFDSGIYQRVLGLDIPSYLISDNSSLINNGSLAEVFAGLEIIAGSSPFIRPQMYYWHREAKASNAEVDYVVSREGTIFPVEVKAGTKGQMQSMFLFLKDRGLQNGIRLSQENFNTYQGVITMPIYAAGRVVGENPI